MVAAAGYFGISEHGVEAVLDSNGHANADSFVELVGSA